MSYNCAAVLYFLVHYLLSTTSQVEVRTLSQVCLGLKIDFCQLKSRLQISLTCCTNDFQSCYGSNSTTLLAQTCYDKKLTGLLRLDSTFNLIQPCTKLLLSSLLQPCWPTWPQSCYGLVRRLLFRRLVSTLSTTCYRLVRATSQQPVRTQLDIGLTEQHCNNTVTSLLQTVRFYV